MKTRRKQVNPLTQDFLDKTIDHLKLGTPVHEIYDDLGIPHNSFYAWVMDSLFGPADKRPELHQKLREAFLNTIFRDIVLDKILQVIDEPQEKVIVKETTVHGLSKAEHNTLTILGYQDFIEQFEEEGILLKVEKTRETIPIPVALLERLIKLVESGTSVGDIVEKLMDFNPVHPETPDV